MPESIQDLATLQIEANVAINEKLNLFGRCGIPRTDGSGKYEIPVAQYGQLFISVTLENGTVVQANASRVSPIPGQRVRLRKESGVYVIKGTDYREGLLGNTGNATANLPKHNHNPGAPPGMFYIIDPAGLNDGLVLPTGSGLNVSIGRVTYPKTDGTLGIYDADDTLDLATGTSGLAGNQQRWVVIYILRSDGTANFFAASAETAPVNTTTHIEDAIAECLDSIPDAFPYHVARMKPGMSTFGTYQAMIGRNMETKDLVRLGFGGATGVGSTSSVNNTIDGDRIIPSGKDAFIVGDLAVTDGTLVVEGELYIL